MKITDLINNYNPLYPEPYNWESTFAYLQEHKTEWDTVQQLVQELKRDGKFRNPIVLSTPEDDTDDETGEYEPHVKNGTHRVFAHYLTGIEPVNIQHSWNTKESEMYPYSYTEVYFTKPLTEQEFDLLINKFRSHKVSDETWLECDLVSGKEQEATFYWAGAHATNDILNDTTKNIINTELPHTNYTFNTITIHSEEEENQIFNQQPPQ